MKPLTNLDNYYPWLKTHTAKFYLQKDLKTIIKLCYEIDKEKLEYFKNLKIKENITYPLNIFDTNKKYGYAYEMTYYDKSFPISSETSYLLPKKIKLEIIKELYNTLKKLHEYIILGDIHKRNILITPKNKGIFIDWDGYTKIDEPKLLYTKYNIDYKTFEDGDSPLTDTIKFVTLCASLITGKDYEYFFNYAYNYQYVFDIILQDLKEFENIAHILTTEREHNMFNTSLTEEQLILGLTKKMD